MKPAENSKSLRDLATVHIDYFKKNSHSLPDIFINDYLRKLKNVIDELPLDRIDRVAEILLDAYDNGKQVYVMGNGGSAATASHIVCDLAKGTIWPVAPGDKRFRVVSMSDNIPLMTAWTNDIDYTQVFREQLLNIVNEGDVIIGISGSGNSMNIIKAMEYANSRGAVTIGITGCGGGMLKNTAKECIIVNTDNMERAEDAHLILGHVIKLYLNIKLNLREIV